MDTIKTVAEERHFFTAELRLESFGQVLLIGDEVAVKRLGQIVSEHAEHELVHLVAENEAA